MAKDSQSRWSFGRQVAFEPLFMLEFQQAVD